MSAQAPLFPVLPTLGAHTGVPSGLPWGLVERWRLRIERNHSQKLERLAQRGGLSWCELWCAANDRELYPVTAWPSERGSAEQILALVTAYAAELEAAARVAGCGR